MVLEHAGLWVTLTVLSAIFLSIQRVIQKKALLKDHASEYLTTMCLLAWIFLLPFITKIDLSLSLATWLLLIFKSVLVTVSWIAITRAYKHMEISTVEPLKNISPIFLLFSAMIFLREAPTLQQIFGVLLIIFGGYILETFLHPKLFKNPLALFSGKYVHYLIFAAFLAGISGIFDKLILKETDALTTMFFMFFFSSIMLFIHQHLVYKGWSDVRSTFKRTGFMICAIVIITLISDWLYFTAVGLKDSYVSLIVPIRRVSSIFVILAGGEIFHEKSIIEKILSCIIMLVGAYLIVA